MPNPSPFGTNAFGVTSQPLDYTKGAPQTMSYHGMTICVNGNIVGRINSWHPDGAYSRDGEHVYELSSFTIGKPIDYVPGKSTGFTVSFTRTEVWGEELELTMGYPNVFATLADQTYPFVIQEFVYKGQAAYRKWQYSGCWFKAKNPEAFTADGNYIYKVTGQIAYVSRIKVN
jgi:hypothetical protein